MVSYILLCVVGISIMNYMMYVVGFGIVCHMVCCMDRYNEIYDMVSFGIMHEMSYMMSVVGIGIMHYMMCCRYWYHALYGVL